MAGGKQSKRTFVVTTYGTDGATAAAMVLQKHPEAEVVITSTSRAPRTLNDLLDGFGRGEVHVCGLGFDSAPEPSLGALAAFKEKGVKITWYCGRGYLDEYASMLSEVCTTVIRECASNTEAVFRHLALPKTRRVTMLLELAAEFAGKAEAASSGHQWWHDLIQATAGRFFKYDDSDAFPACIRKLAGQAEVNPLDEREVERWRAYSGKSLPLGRSRAMQRLRKLITRLAPVNEPVLICGPSGAGKEMVARLLHEASDRADGPFVPVNCAILSSSPDLALDRLFGHKAGAYTGARDDGQGAFEAADDGTLFLDEVGELPLDAQTQLLRVLEEGMVLPLGTMTPRPVNVRVVAATNRDLPSMIESGAFRLDLYHRLSVLALDVPALRERREDMKSIANSVIHDLKDSGYKLKLSKSDWKVIGEYQWPGNIRQFINILKRAAYMKTPVAEVLREEMLRFAGAHDRPAAAFSELDLFWPSDAEAITPEAKVRDTYMRHCLDLCGGNWTLAASRLGVAVNTLRKRLGA